MRWLFLLATSCAAYDHAWRADGACYARCQDELDVSWGGGEIRDDSEYCICVTSRDDVVYTLFVPKQPWGAYKTWVNWKWSLPSRLRSCADRTAMVCGIF